MPRDVAILQPGYLPWLGYFDQVASADLFVLYDDVQFDKHGWRNRNRILLRGQPHWLTVPVSLGFGQAIRDVRVADPRFAGRHVRTLRQTYARAPHFAEMIEPLESYLLSRTWTWLTELCVEGHAVLCGLLGIETELAFASALGHAGEGRTARLVAICGDLGATRYIASSASRDYMEPARWDAAGIELIYQDYEHPTYPQAGPDFVSHLSAVDALMQVGAAQTRRFVGTTKSKLRRCAGSAP